MPSSTTRTVGPAVNTIDYSALESLEAINRRLKDGGLTLYLSEDPNSVFVGQRLVNGWKNSGCPRTYKLTPERMVLPKAQ